MSSGYLPLILYLGTNDSMDRIADETLTIAGYTRSDPKPSLIRYEDLLSTKIRQAME